MMTTYSFVAEWLKGLTKTERGASLVEYALLVALIAVVCIIAISIIGDEASTAFTSVADELSGVNN